MLAGCAEHHEAQRASRAPGCLICRHTTGEPPTATGKGLGTFQADLRGARHIGPGPPISCATVRAYCAAAPQQDRTGTLRQLTCFLGAHDGTGPPFSCARRYVPARPTDTLNQDHNLLETVTKCSQARFTRLLEPRTDRDPSSHTRPASGQPPAPRTSRTRSHTHNVHTACQYTNPPSVVRVLRPSNPSPTPAPRASRTSLGLDHF